MTNEEVLRTFLKKHKKYTSYKHHYDKQFKTVQVEKVIAVSFYWSHTKEGHAYWSDINHKWKELCTHFDLNGVIYITKV